MAARAAARSGDPCSLASAPEALRVTHVDLDWTADFDHKVVRGHVVLHGQGMRRLPPPPPPPTHTLSQS
jgi:hypothetical protein